MSTEVKKVYKYFSINEYLYSNIINRELFMTNPSLFNDPYDTTPIFKVSKNKDNVKRLFDWLKGNFLNYEKVIKENAFADERLSELLEIISFYKVSDIFDKLWKLDPTKLQISIYNHYRFILFEIHNYGVFCTSTTPNCPLMWGHYANDHKGVCIEFLTHDHENKPLFEPYDGESKFLMKKLDYSNEPIEFFTHELPTENADLNVKVLTTKSSNWKYESEIRFINRTQGLTKFNPNCLSKIIFGNRTTARDKYNLTSLISNYFIHTKVDIGFYKSELLFNEYQMTMTPMTIEDLIGSGADIEELFNKFQKANQKRNKTKS